MPAGRARGEIFENDSYRGRRQALDPCVSGRMNRQGWTAVRFYPLFRRRKSRALRREIKQLIYCVEVTLNKLFHLRCFTR